MKIPTEKVPAILIEYREGELLARVRDVGLVEIVFSLLDKSSRSYFLWKSKRWFLGLWFLIDVQRDPNVRCGWRATKIWNRLGTLLPKIQSRSEYKRTFAIIEEVPAILTGIGKLKSFLYSEHIGRIYMEEGVTKGYSDCCSSLDSLLGEFSVTVRPLPDDTMDRAWLALKVEVWDTGRSFPEFPSLKKFVTWNRPTLEKGYGFLRVDELDSPKVFFAFTDCAEPGWALIHLQSAVGFEGVAVPTVYNKGINPYRAVYVKPLMEKPTKVSMLHITKDSLTQGKEEKWASDRRKGYRTFYGQDKEITMSEFLLYESSKQEDSTVCNLGIDNEPLSRHYYADREIQSKKVRGKEAGSMTDGSTTGRMDLRTLKSNMVKIKTMIYNDEELLDFLKEKRPDFLQDLERLLK